jgi:hypothetical protein
MSSSSQFPFRSRGYYFWYGIAARLLPRALFLRFFGDADSVPRPLPGSPQVWLDAIAGRNSTARKDATLIIGDLRKSDAVDPAPFIAALKSDDEDVVFWSLVALERIGAPAKAGLTQIAVSLQHPAFGVRQAAIGAIAKLGIYDEQVQDIILTVLDDTDPFVRAEAVRALARARALREDIIAKVRSLLRDPDEDVRHCAEKCLERHT